MVFLKRIFLLTWLLVSLCSVVFAIEETLEEMIESGESVVSGEEQVEETKAPSFRFETLKAKVIEAGNPYDSEDEMQGKYQDLRIFINDHDIKTTYNTTASLTYYIDTTNYAKPYKVGDKVFVYTTFQDNQLVSAEVVYRNSTSYIILLFFIFVLTVVLIGGVKGIKSIIGLFITVLLIFEVMIPGIIKGKNPLMLTIVISILTIILTFLIIGGFKKKSYAAMIGTCGGIIVSGILALVFGNLFSLSGMCEETGTITVLAGVAKGFDFRGILFSGIIIGALGACMDVGMSLSSALFELKDENPEITTPRLIKAGMNIGRDMIGTMTNTLILAYVGGAVLTILLQVLGGLSIEKIINQEIISEEILRSIAGSIGLVLTIPITAISSGLMMGKKQKKGRESYER